MAVLATQMATERNRHLPKAAKNGKSEPGMRPETATLEGPVILDITFLKKLDMTSFTKKGLMAISKICGISLVKRVEDGRIRKRLTDRGRKDTWKRSMAVEPNNENGKIKWATSKRVPKIKVTDSSDSRTKPENLKHNCKVISLRVKEPKPSIDDLLYGPIQVFVTEPCKTCGRSQQPERFHSHPRRIDHSKTQKTTTESSKKLNTPKQNNQRRHSTGHLHVDKSVRDLEPSFHSDHEIESIKMSLPRTDNGSLRKVRQFRKTTALNCSLCDLDMSKLESDRCRKSRGSTPVGNTANDLKYITGCYICGAQMSPELRASHEEQCIGEWRKQNSQLPAHKRRPEPLRPDFRFTAEGDVDFEGTFNSIWANHMDSLVPCGKCRRTFFPERIEKHEACCNGQSIKTKHQTPRKKHS